MLFAVSKTCIALLLSHLSKKFITAFHMFVVVIAVVLKSVMKYLLVVVVVVVVFVLFLSSSLAPRFVHLPPQVF